jgi:hypothetical protein
MQPQKNQRARAAPKENRNTHREGTEQTEFGSIFFIKLFSLRPQRLRGETSDRRIGGLDKGQRSA